MAALNTEVEKKISDPWISKWFARLWNNKSYMHEFFELGKAINPKLNAEMFATAWDMYQDKINNPNQQVAMKEFVSLLLKK